MLHKKESENLAKNIPKNCGSLAKIQPKNSEETGKYESYCFPMDLRYLYNCSAVLFIFDLETVTYVDNLGEYVGDSLKETITIATKQSF